MENSKIVFDHITKIFKTRKQTIIAVEDYSMEIKQGEFVSILGPSGCGKSTLIRMLDGIIKPTRGDIYVDGEKVTGIKRTPPSLLHKMGFIFQQANLLPWYTIRENVALPLKIIGMKDEEAQRKVDELMAMVGLEKHANDYPVNVSKSMEQRAGVIRAMVYDPEILLMDEPFGSLDEISREQLDMELLKIWESTGKTIIFITHSIEEAVLLSSRIYVMATQPGRLTDVVDIGLNRPRTLDMMTDPQFVDYQMKLTDLIGELDISTIK